MPWWLRLLDISFYFAQLVALVWAIHYYKPEGTFAIVGFCLLYVLFLYVTMAVFINLLPERHQKYFLDKSADNPDGTSNPFDFLFQNRK